MFQENSKRMGKSMTLNADELFDLFCTSEEDAGLGCFGIEQSRAQENYRMTEPRPFSPRLEQTFLHPPSLAQLLEQIGCTSQPIRAGTKRSREEETIGSKITHPAAVNQIIDQLELYLEGIQKKLALMESCIQAGGFESKPVSAQSVEEQAAKKPLIETRPPPVLQSTIHEFVTGSGDAIYYTSEELASMEEPEQPATQPRLKVLNRICLPLFRKTMTPTQSQLESLAKKLKPNATAADIKFYLPYIRAWFRQRKDINCQKVMEACHGLIRERNWSRLHAILELNSGITINLLAKRAHLDIDEMSDRVFFVQKQVRFFLANQLNHH